MLTNEKLIGALNDLMRINNERFDGYKKALKETHQIDRELRNLFFELADESRKNTSALIGMILKLRTSNATGAALTGNIYRGWLQSKADLKTIDRDSLIDYCTLMELLVHKAYDSALKLDVDFPEHILNMLREQKQKMKGSYNLVNGHHYETAAA